MSQNRFVLEMKNIFKAYSGNLVLDSVDLDVRKGEVHAIIGANGAGKSTLMKILNGVVRKDSGEIILNGKMVDINNVGTAQSLGISMVSQDPSLVPMLTVGENIFLNREPQLKALGLVNRNLLFKKAEQILHECNLDIDPKAKIADLSVSERQSVEIARAISSNAEIIIMDEPTSSLTSEEVNKLYNIIKQLKDKGNTILYISHRLGEIFNICDRVTVLRNGRVIGDVEKENFSIPLLVNMMMGEQPEHINNQTQKTIGPEILSVHNICRKADFENINFSVREGEIVGLAGLIGSGRTEILKAIFGANPITQGEIFIQGTPKKIRSVSDALRYGIFLIPEDRTKEGLIESFTIRHNISLASLKRLFRILINDRKEDNVAKDLIAALGITPPQTNIIGRYLSGGNQQKVVVSKAFCTQPKVLLLDEITKGVDVKAKAEIYQLITDLVNRGGVGVILTSVELGELVQNCDRIIVLHNRHIVKEFEKDEIFEEKILTAMFGG